MSDTRLKKDALGLLPVIALSVAVMGPVMAVNMNNSLMAADVGSSGALSFLLATIACGFVAVSFVKFNQVFSTAGSVYTFVQKSMGDHAAAVSGWLLILEYWTWACGCCALAGAILGLLLQSLFGLNLPWIIYGAAFLLLNWYVNYAGVKVSTNVMAAIMLISILLSLILAAVILIKVGMTTGLSWAPLEMGKNTPSAIGLGMIFAVLSFGGFEGASSLGEESRNPKVYIPIAIVSAVVGAGLFFIIMSYTTAIGFGLNASGVSALSNSAESLVDLSKHYLGSFLTVLMSLGYIISTFSCALGSMTTGSRTMYAMSQDGFAPRFLSHVHKEFGSPDFACHLMLAVSAVVLLVLVGNSGSTVYGWIATTGGLAVMLAYMATSLGAMILFGRQEHWTWQMAFPIISLALMGYCFYSNIYPVPTYPYNLLPYITIAWVVVGYIISMICKKSHSSASVSGSIEG
jgi:amino acid transporter